MRTLLKIFFLLYSGFSFGQTNQAIPKFYESNDSLINPILNLLDSDLQTIFVFSTYQFMPDSYSSLFATNYILTYDGKNWKRQVVRFVLTNKKATSVKKKSRKKVSLNQAFGFIKELDLKFWSLNQDSLIIATNNPENEIVRITHGSTETFEVLHDGKYFTRWTYEPEKMQKYLYTTDRQVFIESRKRFLELFK